MNMLKKTHAIACLLGLSNLLPNLAEAANYYHFGWDQVSPGVWFGQPLPDSFQGGNVTIVALTGGGSLVVDSQNSESFGQEILDKAKEVGHGPVRYLINTHLHQDHVGGNAAFRKDNPDIKIIAHRATCTGIKQKTMPRMGGRLPGLTKGLEDMIGKRTSLARNDPAGVALDRRIEGTQRYIADAKDFHWALPDVCLELMPGDVELIPDTARRIEVRYFGRGHSVGDLVVYLPSEKIAIVGDLWGAGSGFPFLDAGLDGRDGSILETPVTLKRLHQLDFDLVLTGHTPPLHGKSSLDAAISYGDQLVHSVREYVNQGLSISVVSQKMPPPENAPFFVSDVWRSTVVRAFEEIELREQLHLPMPEVGVLVQSSR